MAAQEDGRPASWLRAVHLCPAGVLVFPPVSPLECERHHVGLQAFDRRSRLLTRAAMRLLDSRRRRPRPA